jgi:hypothetical protein
MSDNSLEYDISLTLTYSWPVPMSSHGIGLTHTRSTASVMPGKHTDLDERCLAVLWLGSLAHTISRSRI